MPNTAHGDNTYVFGIDSGFDIITGCKLESLSIDGAPEFEAMAKDRTGAIVSHVVGADKQSFTASGFLTTGDGPVIGSMFDFDGFHFIINKVGITSQNTDFQKIEVGGQAFKLVTA